MSKSQLKNLFDQIYISIVILIFYLFSIFLFKIVDCIYFTRLQSWRLQTFVRITKLIIWNTCLLIIISKYESIFINKEYFFSYILADLKLKVKEADFISKLESDFKRSALVDFFSNFDFFLEQIYDLYFKALVYICFKFCVLNVLKFFYAVELVVFLLFKHKYTVPYCFVYAAVFFLVFPEYNFFIVDSEIWNSRISSNNISNSSKNSSGIEHSGLDFLCFCYVVLFSLIGYLFLFLYRLRISIWKKCNINGAKIQLVFYSIFILGLFFLIEFLFKIIKLKGILSN